MSTLIGKPIVNTSFVFDKYTLGQEGCKINFKWNGQKANGNRITIIAPNGTTKTHDILGLSSAYHPLNYDICTQLGIYNGHTYKATITMLDYDGSEISNASEQFMIHSYSTPVFEIINVPNVIKSTSFTAMINYESTEGMQLQNYKFNLYKNGVLVDSSPELYLVPNENTTDYSTCSYKFSLEDKSNYTIEAVGLTVYGMNINVSYDVEVAIGGISYPSVVDATANQNGNIDISIQCTPMKYESDNVLYTNNDEIALNKGYVKYSLIESLNDFKFKAKLRNITDFNKEIVTFKDYTNTNDNIISIKPKVYYEHNTTDITTSTTGLIKPTEFTYNNTQYIDYIESAYMRLCLCINDDEYFVSSSNIILSYDSNTDKFFLDENKNIILEVIKKDGNYSITITEI